MAYVVGPFQRAPVVGVVGLRPSDASLSVNQPAVMRDADGAICHASDTPAAHTIDSNLPLKKEFRNAGNRNIWPSCARYRRRGACVLFCDLSALPKVKLGGERDACG